MAVGGTCDAVFGELEVVGKFLKGTDNTDATINLAEKIIGGTVSWGEQREGVPQPVAETLGNAAETWMGGAEYLRYDHK
jgi:hypothetical protein